MRNKLVILIVVAVLALTGCEMHSETVSESTIFINKDGTIKSVVVEPFPVSLYDIDELRLMIRENIGIYENTHDVGDVRLVSCEVSDDFATVVIDYNSSADYAEFNERDFYFGTVSAALDAGYAKSATLKNAHGTNTVTGSLINDMATYHMIVFDEDVKVNTYASVLYYSSNLNVISDTLVERGAGSKGLSYIIVK